MFLLLVAAFAALATADPILLPEVEDGRIVGGKEVPIEQFPYQVSLNFKGFLFCGGSIISDRYVLTAAHCLKDWQSVHLPYLSVRAGSNKTHTGGTEHNIVSINVNEQYGAEENINSLSDVGLVEVSPPFEFGETTQPIKLVDENFKIKPKSLVTVSGFGLITSKGPLSKTLRAVTMPTTSVAECRRVYESLGQEMVSDIICAGYENGRKDSCQGDSGSPLVYKGKQVGIVSWGYGCGEQDILGVYQSVAAVRSFIESVANI